MPSFALEEAVRKRAGNSSLIVCGVDEVGVGSLAGPVVAAAVVLPGDAEWFQELDDSKRLTWRKRERLHDFIMDSVLAVGVGYETNDTIDTTGIADARRRAIRKAFQGCKEALRGTDNLAAVVDDRRLGWLRADLGGRPSIFSDKADAKSYSVAAASIVAKVLRDRYMTLASNNHPRYGFSSNKGYGTPEHLEALRRYGPSPLHRKTFSPLKQMLTER